MRRFTAQIDKAGDARLHLERHLVLRDARLDLWILHGPIVKRVERVDRLDRITLHHRAHAVGIRDV